MKIELDLPDWIEEEKRGIWINAGIECVAKKMPWEDFWLVKSSRCSVCGKCCSKIDCPHLTDDNRCRLGTERPWRCSNTDPRNVPECTSKYKKVK